MGRGHTEPETAEGGAVGFGATPARTGPDRESCGAFRTPAPAALDLSRNANGFRLVSGAVLVLRRLSRRGAAGETSGSVVALHPRLAHRNDHCPRRVVALPGGQTGVAASVVRVGLCVFRPNPVLHQDAGPAPGRGQHHDAGPLSRSADGRGHADGIAEIRRRGGTATKFQPEVAGPQHSPDDRWMRSHPGESPRGPRALGTAGRVRRGRPSGERGRRRLMQGLLLARPQPRSGFRGARRPGDDGD